MTAAGMGAGRRGAQHPYARRVGRSWRRARHLRHRPLRARSLGPASDARRSPSPWSRTCRWCALAANHIDRLLRAEDLLRARFEPEQRSSALAGSRHREAVRSRPRFARRSPGETAAQDEEVRPAVQTGRARLQRSPQTATKGYKILHIEICRRRSDVTDEACRAPTRSNRRLRARAS